MKKLFMEIITSKIFALWIVVAALLISFFAVSYHVDDTKTERFSIEKYKTVESLNEEILSTKIELEEINNDDNVSEIIKENAKQKLRVLYELKRNNAEIEFDTVYQGQDTSTEDRVSFVFNNIRIVVALSMVSAFIIIYIIFTREFDEGVFIHIYNKNRTMNIIKRLSVFVLTQSILYTFGYLILKIFATIYPQVYKLGLVVDSDKAYFVNITQFEIQYGFLRYFYIMIFASLILFFIAVVLQKSLPSLIISALTVGGLYALVRYTVRIPLALGLVDSTMMFYCSKQYYDHTVLFVLLMIVGIIVYSLTVFERKDL